MIKDLFLAIPPSFMIVCGLLLSNKFLWRNLTKNNEEIIKLHIEFSHLTS